MYCLKYWTNKTEFLFRNTTLSRNVRWHFTTFSSVHT